MTDFDDDYTPEPDPDDYDERLMPPAKEEPDYEDDDEAENHAVDYREYATQGENLAKKVRPGEYDDDPAVEHGLNMEMLAQAQALATLALAAATMHAAARADRPAPVRRWLNPWQVTAGNAVIGTAYWTFEAAAHFVSGWWALKHPDHAAALLMWQALSPDHFLLLANGHSTGVSMKQLPDEPPF
jgi:hypothetical protein